MPSLSSQVDSLERRAHKLSSDWGDVESAYKATAATFEAAERNYGRQRTAAVQAGEDFSAARVEWEAARERWLFFQKLVELAAAVDAANLERFRALSGGGQLASATCSDGMSTREYRRQLEGRGVDLTGKDVDHIVPRSLGGADHPSNYQLLSSSENRSLGATWDTAKCRGAGLAVCAAAMVISKKCGAFGGPFY